MSRILITIPTWNEARIIERTIEIVQAAIRTYLPAHDVLIEVVDNASTDDTADIAERSGVSVLKLVEKGKGRAIRESWGRHIDDKDIFVFTDADLAADLSALPRLIEPIVNGKTDIVCGSRFIHGAHTERRISREIASRAYRILQRVFLRLPVTDAQCGFKAISVGMAIKILPKCVENGWMFDSEFLAVAAVQEARILEIPVTWIEHRDPGRRSAINLFKHGWGFLLGLAKIWVRVQRLG
jgi:glycosyltransferase involved in cell wall biosynthesis